MAAIAPARSTLLSAALTTTLMAVLGASPTAAEPIVVVHGVLQSASDRAEVERALGHDVTLMDLPGRDASDEAASAVTPADHVAAVEAAGASAIDSGGAPVVPVGRSFGGIAVSAAAEPAPAIDAPATRP